MAKKPAETSAGLQQLKTDLKQRRLGRCYVLYGEEDYLRRYYLQQMQKLLLDDLTADFNFHRMNPENFTLQLLADSLEALPMMAERSLVLVEDVDLFALDEAGRNAAAGLLSDLPEHCCLILSMQSFAPDKRMKKLWAALEQNAVLVEFRYQSETDLRAWIARHFRAAGKSITPQLCTYLLSLCGLSMTQLDLEIGKICAFSGAEEVVRADIDAVVEPTLEAVVFQITDALGQGRFDAALEYLNTVLKMQESPIAVVAAIGAQMRRLRAAKLLQTQGVGESGLAQLCGIKPFAAGKLVTQARRLSERFCEQGVLLCCQTDLRLKSSAEDPQRAVEELILRLAEEARRD